MSHSVNNVEDPINKTRNYPHAHAVSARIHTSPSRKCARADSDATPKTPRSADPEPATQHGHDHSGTSIREVRLSFAMVLF